MKMIKASEFYKIITEKDIDNAINYIEQHPEVLTKKTEATKYNILGKNGKQYSPKETLRQAAKLLNLEIDGYGFIGGDANKPFERLGYKVIIINGSNAIVDTPNLELYWTNYKNYFKLPVSEHPEKYKWPVLKQVYDKWNWSAEDKATMFKNAFEVNGSNNLWTSRNFYPLSHTIWMFENFREETENIFDLLFNEEIILIDRIKSFLKFYDEKLPELQKMVPDKRINYHSHNDLRAIALYLSLQYPNKYFLYKYGMVDSFCEKLNLPKIIAGDKNNLSKYFAIANDVLSFIKKDTNFLEEYRLFTNQNENYNDDDLHLLTQDFIYSIANDYLGMKKKYWLYSPGENAIMWEEFYNDGIIALGWDDLGDLNQYESKKDMVLKLQELGNTKGSKKNDATANFEFKNIASVGDIVIVKKGLRELLGFGEITSDYYFDNTKSKFKSCRKIEWKKKGIWKTDQSMVLKTFTDITNYSADSPDYTFYYENLLGLMEEKITINQNSMNFPLNQILYGPPGTGKTYKTKELAVEIITGNKIKDRIELTKVYDELKKNNQINFITFHQSISYEDFIEGIKPKMNSEDPSIIQYEIKKGIFKEMCKIAQEKKVNNFEYCYSKLIEDLIGVELLELETPNGYKFSISLNRNNNLSLHTGNKKLKQGTLTKENILKQLNGEVKFDGWEGYFNGVIEYLKIKYNFSIENSKNQQQKYVLIIDEINRGNISAIFGELITLIEEDKRKGVLKTNEEVLEVELPYSRDKFSVPDNLYIVGTMNTADRSIEALDTALRRRFSFIEMQPDLNVLEEEHSTNAIISDGVANLDMVKMLEKINKRIEILLNKDHKIGHSFFINLSSFKELQLVFKDKIIPLLEEYFFGDFGKIGLVLGESFIKNTNVDKKDIFAKFDDYEDRSLLTDKLVYEISNPMNLGLEHFKAIYE